jgi:hypothetical protein
MEEIATLPTVLSSLRWNLDALGDEPWKAKPGSGLMA